MRPLAEAMATECGSESERVRKSRESARGSSHSFFFRRGPLPLLLFVHPIHLEMAVEGTEYVAHPWHDGDPGDEFPECEFFFMGRREKRWLGDWLAAEGERGRCAPHRASGPTPPLPPPRIAEDEARPGPQAWTGRAEGGRGEIESAQRKKTTGRRRSSPPHPSVPTPLTSGDAWGRRRRPPQKRPRS